MTDVVESGGAPGSETRCAGCGSCCQVLALDGNPESMRFVVGLAEKGLAVDPDRLANYKFTLEHMHQISVRLAYQINPRKVMQDVHGNFYLCDRYEATTQRCMAYDNRPPMCQGFPIYGRKLSEDQLAYGLAPYAKCSFWQDIDKSLWPDYVEPLPSPVSVC